MEQSIKNMNRKRPLAIAGLTAVCAVLFCMFTNMLAACIAAAVLIFLVFLFCIFHKYNTAIFTLIVAGVFLLSALSFFYKETCIVEPSKALVDQTVSVCGTLYEKPTEKENTTLFALENCVINGKKTKLKINVYCKSYDPSQIGDVIWVEDAEIFAAAEQGEFYYHTLSEGNWLRAYTPLAVNTGETKDTVRYKVKRLRETVSGILFENLGEEEGGIAAALLTGDRSALSEDFATDLRIAGGSHLFAVSGMHLSIWTGLLFLILRKRSRIKLLPNIAAVTFVLCYMPVTGFSPSVLRAGLMLIILFIGKMIRKESDGLNSLGISALILLTANIYLAGNISFLLSFSATWGIIVLSPYFSFRFARKGKKPNPVRFSARWILNTIVISLIALSFTLPISAFFFTGVSLLSPVTTLLCTLPVEATMISSFLAICYSTIPYLGKFFFTLCAYSSKAIVFFIQKLSEWDFCVIPIHQKFLLLWYGVTGLILLIVYYRFGKKSVRVLLTLLLSAALLLTTQLANVFTERQIPCVYIHSAGNSTAVSLYITGHTFCAQIGTGADYSTLERIKTFYAYCGVSKPDALIIPRVSEAENGNTGNLKTISKAIYTASGNDTLAPENDAFREADNFTLCMANTFTYTNRTNPVFSGGVLHTDAVKIVFSFWPGGDFSEADEMFLSGDHLICRGGIPKGLDIANFEHVLVLSDKTAAELSLPPGVQSTAETGDIIIIASASE